jgi:hypothetical protein
LYSSKHIISFFTNKGSSNLCLNPTIDIFFEYAKIRKNYVSDKIVKKELYNFIKIHKVLVERGYAKPLTFNINMINLKSDEQFTFNYSEKFFENIIKLFPERLLNEKLYISKLKFISNNLIHDIIFQFDDGSFVIFEILKVRFDRYHSYKILDYRDNIELQLCRTMNSKPVMRMIIFVVGSSSNERSDFLKKYGIDLITYKVSEIENIILDLLSEYKSIKN